MLLGLLDRGDGERIMPGLQVGIGGGRQHVSRGSAGCSWMALSRSYAVADQKLVDFSGALQGKKKNAQAGLATVALRAGAGDRREVPACAARHCHRRSPAGGTAIVQYELETGVRGGCASNFGQCLLEAIARTRLRKEGITCWRMATDRGSLSLLQHQ